LWVIALVVVGLVLVLLGRLAARASVAGQIPSEQGPDVKSGEAGLRADIRPEDQGPDTFS
jgi:hypothetical protein